jgi:hypothetical protein
MKQLWKPIDLKLTDLLVAELLIATGIEPKKGEPAQAFTKRMLSKLDGLSDKRWERLSEDAQCWINALTLAREDWNEINRQERSDDIYF